MGRYILNEVLVIVGNCLTQLSVLTTLLYFFLYVVQTLKGQYGSHWEKHSLTKGGSVRNNVFMKAGGCV